jgi:DNA invertase Pin-like site-specific DNA recombinase
MKEPDLRVLIEKLSELSRKIDLLIQVVAVTSRKENIEEKSKKQQIKILSDMGLSRNLIALIVGTTPETVSVRLSEGKAKKTVEPKEVEEKL